MRKIRLLLLCVLSLSLGQTYAQTASKIYKYRVYLIDKKHSPYVKSHPEKFLSQASLQRRKRLHIRIDDYDLPVSPRYVAEVNATGAKVICMSKWNNTLLISAEGKDVADSVATLKCVRKVTEVYSGIDTGTSGDSERSKILPDTVEKSDTYYGKGKTQIEMLNGIKLHEAGFRGKGMTIAVIDGGFANADTLRLLNNVRILGTHNFTRPSRSVFMENQHGTNVLSCMAANKPYEMIGTAPDASYWLLVSEDTWSESPAEEDTWAAAIEFADSVGADVVNSSLGYNIFDDATKNVKYRELNGRTHLISHSASLAASRGILVCNSAGNSGDESWKLIGVPADADNIITVGAVNKYAQNALFSSLGNTADGRIKPDVAAMGILSQVVRSNGRLGTANGTSFSSPITAGMVACLAQALPKLRPEKIIALLHECSSRSLFPDNVYGYGIPDFYKAYLKGSKKDAK